MADLKAELTETLREALGRLWTEPEDDADKPDWDQLPGKLADALLGLSIANRRWLPGDPAPEPCPHDSLSGDEGPVDKLGRMPHWWRCDSCDALVLNMGVRAPQCDCLDTSVEHHWWDCPLMPIYTETIRAGYVPWMAIS